MRAAHAFIFFCGDDETWQYQGDIVFPTQFFGLKVYYNGSTKDLTLVNVGQAPTGGGIMRIKKGGVEYEVYLVDTADPNASSVRIQTPGGIKSIRLKT